MEQTDIQNNTTDKSRKSSVIMIGLVLALVLFGGGLLLVSRNRPSDNSEFGPQSTNQKQNPDTPETSTETSMPSNSTYTLDEIASHDNKSDCWLAINNKVYDVTKFVPKHPGEDKILVGCGIDATQLFTTKNTGGRIHSQTAHQLLENYYIGELAN